ncbi:hypothetical protein D9V86_12080 [Bacteroidetes/Chlorobi group bacterium ChocPot_Mid]|nr:MAG: hypothetical protein D9V86_12080 [Bacteroidetes/Chlorobi group bacterium ChocPot_Mid]
MDQVAIAINDLFTNYDGYVMFLLGYICSGILLYLFFKKMSSVNFNKIKNNIEHVIPYYRKHFYFNKNDFNEIDKSLILLGFNSIEDVEKKNMLIFFRSNWFVNKGYIYSITLNTEKNEIVLKAYKNVFDLHFLLNKYYYKDIKIIETLLKTL